MIKNKKIDIIVNHSTIKYYNNLGYHNIKSKDVLTIPIEHLPSGSNILITGCCDICEIEQIIKQKHYSNKIKKFGKFLCTKCQCKHTCMERFGVEYTHQSSIVLDKYKKTSLERFGVEHPFKAKEVKDKINKTNIERYGDSNLKNVNSIQEKIRQTCIERYGVDNPLKNKEIFEKSKQTCVERYGVANPLQNKEIFEKLKATNLKKYGVEYVLQNELVFEEMMKNRFKIKKDDVSGLNYQGTYELDFIKFSIDNNIDIIKGLTIPYFINGFKKYYFSDFFIKKYNLIIEVKSSYTYEKDLKINLIKQNTCELMGYNFLFIIDKNYTPLIEFMK